MNQGYYSGLNSEDIQTIFIDSKTKFWLGSWAVVFTFENGSLVL
jgi:hypothetical protein